MSHYVSAMSHYESPELLVSAPIKVTAPDAIKKMPRIGKSVGVICLGKGTESRGRRITLGLT